jgi:predicted ATPase
VTETAAVGTPLHFSVLYRLWVSNLNAGAIAVAIAREQGTRGYELRAATRLARLRLKQGRRCEARELLAPVYDSFTERFGTADLKDAKALLDELA